LKIVFLDFDGVLNTLHYTATDEERESWSRELWAAGELDPDMVVRLNEIVETADASIVLSTSWSHSSSNAVLASYLHLRGLKDPGRVIGSLPLMAIRTPRPGTQRAARNYKFTHPMAPNKSVKWNRLRCILDYLDRVKPEAFVILEDAHPMGPLEDHTVRTNMATGLQSEHVEKALRLLG